MTSLNVHAFKLKTINGLEVSVSSSCVVIKRIKSYGEW